MSSFDSTQLVPVRLVEPTHVTHEPRPTIVQFSILNFTVVVSREPISCPPYTSDDKGRRFVYTLSEFDSKDSRRDNFEERRPARCISQRR
jgi:hypothetical protein